MICRSAFRPVVGPVRYHPSAFDGGHFDTLTVSQDLSLLSFSRRLLSFFDNRLGFPFLDASRRR